MLGSSGLRAVTKQKTAECNGGKVCERRILQRHYDFDATTHRVSYVNVKAHLPVHGQHGCFGIGSAHELYKSAALARWNFDVHNFTKSVKDGSQLILIYL